MKCAWGLDRAVEAFVCSRLEEPGEGFGNAKSLAVLDRHGGLAAGIVFHNWSPVSRVIEVSAASSTPRWATRGVLRTAFGYVFDDANCRLAISRTSEANTPVIRLWRAFGASEYALPELRGPGVAEVIHTLSESQWRGSRYMR